MSKKSSQPAVTPSALIITTSDQKLTRAQAEFNRLMNRLESARKKYHLQQTKLDGMLIKSRAILMPMIEVFNRAELVILKDVMDALRNVKFSKKNRMFIRDFVREKTLGLLGDNIGLDEADIAALESIITELKQDASDDEKRAQDEEIAQDRMEFEGMLGMIQEIARRAGVEVDVSDLHIDMSPDDLQHILQARLLNAMEEKAVPGKSARKQTKAQLEKSARLKALEDAKKRDLRSLYKQLAKVLHPDLEINPQLKVHKEDWMKRLTSAYAEGDLSTLLQIELEWLGEEASNLAAAGDEKLEIYCDVLKEQIREQNERTNRLPHTPQYFSLRRFINPWTGKLGNMKELIGELEDEVNQQERTIAQLALGDEERKRTIESMADVHGHRPF